MGKAKFPASKRAPSSPVAKPGPVKTLTRKKNKKKKKVWKSKAQEVSKKPGSGPGAVVRPPKAPEDFSLNWKVLQEPSGALFLQAPRWTGRRQYLAPKPVEQSTIRKEPRKGQMVILFQNEGTSSIRSGKLRRQPRPHPPRKTSEELEVVQKEVVEMLNGRILVGHALHNDLKVLFLDHPKKKIRDTQKYKPFKSQVKSGRPSLRLLSEKILGLPVQQVEHCSIQDAQATMRLYVVVKQWESMARDSRPLLTAPDHCSDDA
ncbi:RNA exonuclease 4-like isoform X2 [Symphalangus syndactylus]|uniref:RNA exonuclease 4-like isoform X2 n=1 Tax=Symphalangus syndactylus TaxID=9590 RepID=UPI002442F43B|nr:RNA exonuclease 4-like isoform X2 [Symphalangus syndactylus]